MARRACSSAPEPLDVHSAAALGRERPVLDGDRDVARLEGGELAAELRVGRPSQVGGVRDPLRVELEDVRPSGHPRPRGVRVEERLVVRRPDVGQVVPAGERREPDLRRHGTRLREGAAARPCAGPRDERHPARPDRRTADRGHLGRRQRCRGRERAGRSRSERAHRGDLRPEGGAGAPADHDGVRGGGRQPTQGEDDRPPRRVERANRRAPVPAARADRRPPRGLDARRGCSCCEAGHPASFGHPDGRLGTTPDEVSAQAWRGRRIFSRSASVSARAGFAPRRSRISRACSNGGAASGARSSASRQRPRPNSACAAS